MNKFRVTMYKRMSGQSTVGYTIATGAMVLALFVPWGGDPAPMVQFMEAVRELHGNSTYVLSLP